MSDTATIADQLVVKLAYTLTNDEGEELDSSTVEEAFEYLHGAHSIVPGLEKELTGCAVGDRKKVSVAPEEAYGPLGPDGVRHTVEVPREQFPTEAPLEVGMGFTAGDEQGRPFPIWVVDMTDEHVIITPQHPLAGETLHFDVQVLGIREPTAAELEEGRAL